MTTEDPFTLKYAASPTTVLAFRLVVASGANAGRAFEVPPTDARIVLGSGEGCAIVLGDPHVSRRHVALVPAQDRIELEDLGSSNGTWVNGVEVRRFQYFAPARWQALAYPAILPNVKRNPVLLGHAKRVHALELRFARTRSEMQRLA